MTSQITELGFRLDNFEISTEASVWPALSKTPPFLATKGNTWPGDTISLFFTLRLIAVLIVLALSCAEIPVVIPLFASIEIVNAVCILDLLFGDINGNLRLSICFFVKAKQINPLPCLAIKLLFFRFCKFVSFNVCGIIFISKEFLITLEIVNETPLIEIDAFSIKNLERLWLRNWKFIIQVLSIILIFWILATESTWPCVKWPEIFCP